MKQRILVASFVSILLLLPSVSMAITEIIPESNEITPDSIKDWMKTETLEEGSYIPPEDQKRVNILISQVIKFRMHAGDGLDGAIQEIGASADSLSLMTNSPVQKEYPEVWPYVFAGSMVFVGNARSDRPVSAYYNTYLDGIVLISWRPSGGSFVPDRVLAMTGATFLGGKNDLAPLPVWITTNATPVGLIKQYHRVRDHFTELFPFNSTKQPKLDFQYDEIQQRELIEGRSAFSYLLLRTFLHKKDRTGFRELIVELQSQVSAGNVGALARILPADNILSPQQVVEIPKKSRENFIPVYIFVGPDYVLYFQQVNRTPRFITATEFNADGPPEVKSFAFFDLETSFAD